MNDRTLYICAALFFVCAGLLVIWGLRTDRLFGQAAVEHSEKQPLSLEVARTVGMVGGGLLAVLIYFIPALIAQNRRHRERTPIFLVNMFLGWTFLGWILALIWSTSSQVEKPAEPT